MELQTVCPGEIPSLRTTSSGSLASKPSVSASPSRPKVLISDDEPIIADTLALILNKDGFETRAVYTSKNALELAAQFQPDMLISDVIMADLNGIDEAPFEGARLVPWFKCRMVARLVRAFRRLQQGTDLEPRQPYPFRVRAGLYAYLSKRAC